MFDEVCPDDPRGLCGVGDATYTLRWKAPRTKGVQIRVYGVTKCFWDDDDGRAIDGWCLRRHTPLPDSVRVLLAKAPASKGKVTWRMPYEGKTYAGAKVYSWVTAAYNAEGGHSSFAIAWRDEACRVADLACGNW